MRRASVLATILCAATSCWAQSHQAATRPEAEYYVNTYAQHYRVPVALVHAVVESESGWRVCAVSPKGAVGLMQLMPTTAQRLGVKDRCNIDQNVSGGVRYLAWLMKQFHDFRLVAAAYFAGEGVIGRRGLAYRNPEVVAYVSGIRRSYLRNTEAAAKLEDTTSRRDMR
jgi:soluble lytic murein transglycosylase